MSDNRLNFEEYLPFKDCPEDCENKGHCWNTDGCMQRLEKADNEMLKCIESKEVKE